MSAFDALDSAHAQAAEVEARLVDCRSLMMTAILFSRHFAERAAAREAELGTLEKTLTDISVSFSCLPCGLEAMTMAICGKAWPTYRAHITAELAQHGAISQCQPKCERTMPLSFWTSVPIGQLL